MSTTSFDWAEFEAEPGDPANHIPFAPVPRPRAHVRARRLAAFAAFRLRSSAVPLVRRRRIFARFSVHAHAPIDAPMVSANIVNIRAFAPSRLRVKRLPFFAGCDYVRRLPAQLEPLREIAFGRSLGPLDLKPPAPASSGPGRNRE